MRVTVTITTILDLPDEVAIEEVIDEKNDLTYGQHIVYKGHKLKPYVELVEFGGNEADSAFQWHAPDDDIAEELQEIKNEEDYLIFLSESPDE